MTSKTGFWVLYKNGDNVVDIKEGKDEYARETPEGYPLSFIIPRAHAKYARFGHWEESGYKYNFVYDGKKEDIYEVVFYPVEVEDD